MGSSPHSRLVPLTRSAIQAVVQGKEYQQVDRAITPEEAWDSVYSEEGYEDGHSYSGTFGSKSGVVIAVNDKRLTKEMLAVAGDILENVNYGEFDFAKLTPEQAAVVAIIPPVKFMQMNDVYDDKWGPAVGIAGADHAWFGGWCPS